MEGGRDTAFVHGAETGPVAKGSRTHWTQNCAAPGLALITRGDSRTADKVTAARERAATLDQRELAAAASAAAFEAAAAAVAVRMAAAAAVAAAAAASMAAAAGSLTKEAAAGSLEAAQVHAAFGGSHTMHLATGEGGIGGEWKGGCTDSWPEGSKAATQGGGGSCLGRMDGEESSENFVVAKRRESGTPAGADQVKTGRPDATAGCWRGRMGRREVKNEDAPAEGLAMGEGEKSSENAASERCGERGGAGPVTKGEAGGVSFCGVKEKKGAKDGDAMKGVGFAKDAGGPSRMCSHGQGMPARVGCAADSALSKAPVVSFITHCAADSALSKAPLGCAVDRRVGCAVDSALSKAPLGCAVDRRVGCAVDSALSVSEAHSLEPRIPAMECRAEPGTGTQTHSLFAPVSPRVQARIPLVERRAGCASVGPGAMVKKELEASRADEAARKELEASRDEAASGLGGAHGPGAAAGSRQEAGASEPARRTRDSEQSNDDWVIIAGARVRDVSLVREVATCRDKAVRVSYPPPPPTPPHPPRPPPKVRVTGASRPSLHSPGQPSETIRDPGHFSRLDTFPYPVKPALPQASDPYCRDPCHLDTVKAAGQGCSPRQGGRGVCSPRLVTRRQGVLSSASRTMKRYGHEKRLKRGCSPL